MGKGWKLLWIFLVMQILSGCATVRPSPPAVVTKIEIACHHNGQHIQRTYTEPDQLEDILDCLRLQKSRGTAHEDPERVQGAVYEIRVWMSDAVVHIYRHRAGRYLSKDSKPWQRVDPERGESLYELLMGYQQNKHMAVNHVLVFLMGI